MSYEPFFISSFEDDTGLNTYFEPFLAPEKAFVTLEDAYCWRGRVKRRQAFSLLGRLSRTLAAQPLIHGISSPGAGVVNINLFTELAPIDASETNAQIIPGTAANPIVLTLFAPINQTLTDNTGNGVFTIAPAGVITAATINYNTGQISLTFSGVAGLSVATISCFYCPGFPVMGLRKQELEGTNDEGLIAFDRRYAYRYDTGTRRFIELPSVAPTVWHGSDSQFFWSTNYYTIGANRIFWATNCNMSGVVRDPIRYYDTATWTTFAPLITATDTLYNAELIIAYKNRLLFFNTWEGTTVGGIAAATNHPQTVRWSQNGTPFAVDAFRTDIVGRGGYLDAPTSEKIIGIEFVKDTLLVKFESSSWKLVYTNNEVLPFVFQKINTELGAESKFSLVPFDRHVLSVGDLGITGDDSVNVERIDLQIPGTIFSFNNSQNAVARVHGIRQYTKELVYWCYPTAAGDSAFPNRVLVYNYRNNSYAIFKDSFTCFGYFQRSTDLTWADMSFLTWEEWTSAWDSGDPQSLFPDVVAGTQHGYVEILDQKIINDPSLFIRAINFGVDPVQFTVPSHNLEDGDIIKITGIGGGVDSPTALNNNFYKVSVVSTNVITLEIYVGLFLDLFTAGVVDPTSVYYGNGSISKVNGYKIATKRFCPYYEEGAQCRIGYIDFLLKKTQRGALTNMVFIDEEDSTSMTNTVANPALLGTSVVNTCPDNIALIPFQANQKKIWHRQYIQAIAQNFQLVMTLTPEQNADSLIVGEDFELHALAFYLSSNARLTQ
jgi:hypothetical protein